MGPRPTWDHVRNFLIFIIFESQKRVYALQMGISKSRHKAIYQGTCTKRRHAGTRMSRNLARNASFGNGIDSRSPPDQKKTHFQKHVFSTFWSPEERLPTRPPDSGQRWLGDCPPSQATRPRGKNSDPPFLENDIPDFAETHQIDTTRPPLSIGAGGTSR